MEDSYLSHNDEKIISYILLILEKCGSHTSLFKKMATDLKTRKDLSTPITHDNKTKTLEFLNGFNINFSKECLNAEAPFFRQVKNKIPRIIDVLKKKCPYNNNFTNNNIYYDFLSKILDKIYSALNQPDNPRNDDTKENDEQELQELYNSDWFPREMIEAMDKIKEAEQFISIGQLEKAQEVAEYLKSRNFIEQANEIKIKIQQKKNPSIQNSYSSSSNSFQLKYLKYKKKYIQLKNNYNL